MNCAWTLVTAPTLEPIELEDQKLEARMDDSVDDEAIQRRIKSSRERVEAYLGRGLLTQTWKYTQDAFTDTILLPMSAPLQSITTVQYYNDAGTLTTLASSVYVLDSVSEPARIHLAPNQVWPTTQAGRAMAVEITYVVGWTAVDLIPTVIVDAMHILASDREEHRGDETLNSGEQMQAWNLTESLLASQRVWWYQPCG